MDYIVPKNNMKLTPKTMYTALVNKDSSFEGTFYAAVKTTGIFCRPTCTARKPKRENVEFFSTQKDAILHGYRPCKVCSPMTVPGDAPAEIKRILSRITDDPLAKLKDGDLRSMKIEPNKVRRWFKKNHGITFQGYQRMMRINSAFKKLSEGDTITAAAFDSGYDSLSGFSDAFRSLIGTAPSSHRSAAVISMTRFTTPLGPMFACATEDGVCLLEYTDRRMLERELTDIRKRLNGTILFGTNRHLEHLKKELKEYFDGSRKKFTVPLVTPGTDFQNEAWKQLHTIPYGETVSYKEQAKRVKNAKAVRAVANANGCNRISIVIPCHRVIGHDGTLTGYGGGLWRKKWLLDFEKEHV
jgi:AraC family transcriptional regulator of adaptative response/methylated-DNA-[protein]-cysteine methyltransferase